LKGCLEKAKMQQEHVIVGRLFPVLGPEEAQS
jgi:hypothetical protein